MSMNVCVVGGSAVVRPTDVEATAHTHTPSRCTGGWAAAQGFAPQPSVCGTVDPSRSSGRRRFHCPGVVVVVVVVVRTWFDYAGG